MDYETVSAVTFRVDRASKQDRDPSPEDQEPKPLKPFMSNVPMHDTDLIREYHPISTGDPVAWLYPEGTAPVVINSDATEEQVEQVMQAYFAGTLASDLT